MSIPARNFFLRNGRRRIIIGKKGGSAVKREEHREEGLKALDQCEYMVLAMTDLAGEPYCVPLNAVRV